MLCEILLWNFIRFCEHDTIGLTCSVQPSEKLYINRLRCVPPIDQHKHMRYMSPQVKIMLDHPLQFDTDALGNFGITVSWEIDEVSWFLGVLVVSCYLLLLYTFDWEIVEQLCPAWCRTRPRKLLLTTQRIDQARFPDITPSDECILWPIRWWALIDALATLEKCSWGDSDRHRLIR